MKSSVELKRQDDVVILSLVGNFHGHEGVLDEALGRIRERKVVIDFTRCKMLGSEAVRRLVRLKETLRPHGGDVKVCGLPPPRPEVLGDPPPGGKRPFDAFTTPAQALAAFARDT